MNKDSEALIQSPESRTGANNERFMFLPGASGNLDVWKPLADRLRLSGERQFVGWPGFGAIPKAPEINSFADLVSLVRRQIEAPTNLFAQSMGGVIALSATLELPHLVRRLVLSVTSGGVNLASLGASDWRPTFRKNNPTYPSWFETDRTDLTPRLREIRCPVLLLWGDSDLISPVAVGRRLQELLPQAELLVVPSGDHDLVATHVGEILPAVERLLATPVAT
jgi:pimeloyl-ACP methyl ester carboxylesterase